MTQLNVLLIGTVLVLTLTVAWLLVAPRPTGAVTSFAPNLEANPPQTLQLTMDASELIALPPNTTFTVEEK